MVVLALTVPLMVLGVLIAVGPLAVALVRDRRAQRDALAAQRHAGEARHRPTYA